MFFKFFNDAFSRQGSSKKTSSVDVNRDILAHLTYISNYKSRSIGFEKALEYPLTPVPLNLLNADGSMRKNKPIECQWKYAHKQIKAYRMPMEVCVKQIKAN